MPHPHASHDKGVGLFDSSVSVHPLQLRNVEVTTADGELRLQLDEVRKRVAELEEAQVVSPELWESVISV